MIRSEHAVFRCMYTWLHTVLYSATEDNLFTCFKRLIIQFKYTVHFEETRDSMELCLFLQALFCSLTRYTCILLAYSLPGQTF
jgi:hypothetical protein